MRALLLPTVLVALAACGCGGGMAKVKGQLVENGNPMTFPPTQVAIELALIGEDGKPDASKAYTAVVNPDGSFEVVASSGEVKPGTYQVGIHASGKLGSRLKAFAPPTSSIRREIKPGANTLTIDLARPEG